MKRKILNVSVCAAIAALLPTVSSAAVSSIPVTGWTYDIVHNGAGPYATAVTGTMDGGPGFADWTWVEAGTYRDATNTPVAFAGLVAGTQSSLTGNGTFAYQSFSGPNALLLSSGQSASLSLTTPMSYATLALYGSASGGATAASVILTFSDLTTSTYLVASGTGIGTDWFNTNADRAVIVGGRASNRGEDSNLTLFRGTDARIAINETFLTLSAADQAKVLTSVAVSNTAGGRMGVLAISGQAIPEASTSALIAAFGALGLLRRRRA